MIKRVTYNVLSAAVKAQTYKLTDHELNAHRRIFGANDY